MDTFTEDGNAPIAELAARYMGDAHVFVRRPDAANFQSLDRSFQALRLKQRRDWPHLGSAVDALGCAASDLVNAQGVEEFRALASEHDQTMSMLLDALAPAASTCA